MKSINLKPLEIKGIYVTSSKRIIGIPMFRQEGQEYKEYPKCVELWQKNGDGKMHRIRTWRKASVTCVEYADTPNTWVSPRLLEL